MISIIIPTYNGIKKLERTLNSIFFQTYKDIEVIVVDDGSDPPLSPPLLRDWRLASTANRGVVLKIKHGGANKARNFGFNQSKGEYVIFWDDDVIGRPEMLEIMLRALEKHPGASYAYSGHYFGFKKFSSFRFDQNLLKKMNYIHTTSLIRREHVFRFSAHNGPWDESIKRLQDWDLWLTMLEHELVGVFIPELLFKVKTGGTMSSWMPKYAYKKPFRYVLPRKWLEKVVKYEEAVEVIKRKHKLK